MKAPNYSKCDEVKGKTLKEAIECIEKDDYVYRIVEENGKHFIVTMDLNNNRINLTVENGIVTKAYPG